MQAVRPDPGAAEFEAQLGLRPGAAVPRRLRAWLGAGLAIAAALGAVSLGAAWRWRSPAFETRPVERGALVLSVTATGTLEPTDQVDVGSELSGTVESVRVDFNDRVVRGQVLATLDVSQLEQEVNESRAAFESAEAAVLRAVATVRETRLDQERCQRLAQEHVCSQQDLDRAEAALARARAEEASARSQVSLARASLDAELARLEKAVVHAPIDGVVLARYVEPGQTLAATFQTPLLFTLAEDLRFMDLHLDVDEADIGRVREGQKASFGVDAYPGRRFPAVITAVRFAPRSVEGVVTYETLLRVENPELLLRPGMTATAEIETGRRDAVLLVPNAALRFEPPGAEHPARGTPAAGPRVWTLRGGRPVALPIEIGDSDGHRSEVLAGDLSPGLELLVDLAGPDA